MLEAVVTSHEDRAKAPREAALAAAALLCSVGGLALALEAPWGERLALGLAFAGLSYPALVFALPAAGPGLRRWLERPGSRGLYAAGLLAVFSVERLVRGSARDLAIAALYLAVPLLLTADRPSAPRPLWRDLALVPLLWIPLELHAVPGEATLLRLLGLDLLLLLYAGERRLCEPGRWLPSRRREWLWGAGAWAVFLVAAIPFATMTGFAHPGLSARSPGGWLLFLVLTYWIVAVPEEALFRGTIQELLARAWARKLAALVVAAVVFGLAHLDNHNGDPPDWRYVVLATLAGIAYGTAYLRTGNLAAGSLTHFLVDVTWRGFFAGPHA